MTKRIFNIFFISLILFSFIILYKHIIADYKNEIEKGVDIFEGSSLFYGAFFVGMITFSEINIWWGSFILFFKEKTTIDIVFCFILIILSCGILFSSLLLMFGIYDMNNMKLYEVIQLACFVLTFITNIIYICYKKHS